MIFEGLSKYDISIKNDDIVVVGIKRGREMKLSTDRYHVHSKWCLFDDDGRKRSISYNRMRFCVENNVSPLKLIGKRVSLYERPTKAALTKKDKLEKLEAMQHTIRVLRKAYKTDDFTEIYAYAQDNIKGALWVVAKMLFVRKSRLQECEAEAVEWFVKRMQDCTFKHIKPLFNYLCESVKYIYIRHRSATVRAESDDVLDYIANKNL